MEQHGARVASIIIQYENRQCEVEGGGGREREEEPLKVSGERLFIAAPNCL